MTEPRKRDRHRAQDIMRLFHFKTSQYLDTGEMLVECQHCRAVRWSVERIMRRSEPSPPFSNCCQKWRESLPFLYDPLLIWEHLFIGSWTRDSRFRKEIRKYNSALSIGAITAKWVNRCAGTSSIYPKATLQGQIYYYKAALMPAAELRPGFLSVYIF